MSDLEHYSGALAPVVDRLRLAVARGVRTESDAFLHEWELTDSAMAILVLLRNTMPDRLAGWTNVAAAFVYDPPSTVMRGIDDLVERNLIVTSVEGAHLTKKGREAITALYELIGKVTDELWGDHTGVCTTLTPVLRDVVQAAAETGGDAFGLQYPPYEPEGASAPTVLADLLIPLHYHRFDAHVSAWRSTGLSAQEAKLLTGGALWRVLQEDTNVRDAAAYSGLKARQRVDLLAGLGSLPG